MILFMGDLEFPRAPALVGVVTSTEDLRLVEELGREGLDLYELRIDLLEPVLDKIKPIVKTITEGLSIPAIITARDPVEGGVNALSVERRLELLEEWLSLTPPGSFIDIELRNLSAFSSLIRMADLAGKGVIVSVHDFEATPGRQDLEMALDESRKIKALFKVATLIRDWKDLGDLSDFLLAHPEDEIGMMGMGALGKLSRLIFARQGSALAYVGLSETVAPGQWERSKFVETLSEI
jgi:3-dehydroquinate dehydratase I